MFFFCYRWLKSYRSMFPPELRILRPEYKILARSTFKLMEDKKTLLFPVFRKTEDGVTIGWFPPKSAERQAFFGPPETKNLIQNFIGYLFLPQDSNINHILLDLGFDLVHGLFDDLVDIMYCAGSASLQYYLLQIFVHELFSNSSEGGYLGL